MKPYKKILNTSLLIAVLVMANSCTDDFENLNTPANLLTEEKADVDLLLTYVQVQSIFDDRVSLGDASNYCGMFTSESNAPFGSRFGDFAGLYTYLANNLAAIIRKTENDPELINKKAIARILKVWVYSGATDVFGDMPYSESNLAPDKAVLSPVYDTQESIYKDFFKELKEAAAELDAGKESYGGADLMYQGDIAKWKKFANSLRLRLALRVRYADAALATANMSDLQESDLILSGTDDAVAYTSNDVAGNRNRDYNNLVSDPQSFLKGNYPAQTLIDILKVDNDPRIRIYADTAMAAWPPTLDPPIPYFGYRGRPLLGQVPVEEKYPYGAESVSRQSDFWFVPVIERPFLRSSEMYFALAEAALFGLRPGDANAYFNKGIAEGIAWARAFYDKGMGQLPPVSKLIHSGWTDDDASAYLSFKEIQQSEVDAFLASPSATLSGSDEEKLEQIMNQKMVALFPMGDEGWAEWRRTGYPRVLVGSDVDFLKGVSPRRLVYPASEALINSKNYEAAAARIGGDVMLNKVWWDKNPLAPHAHPGTVESMPNPWVN
jgi:hypothetical protein